MSLPASLSKREGLLCTGNHAGNVNLKVILMDLLKVLAAGQGRRWKAKKREFAN